MSDLQEIIARNAVLSYHQGRRDERRNLLELAREASTSNDIGRYVYLDDLNDYIAEWDRGQSAKRTPKED
jgi:hypothetical protein